MKLRKGCEEWAILSLIDRLKNDEKYSHLKLNQKIKILKKESFILGFNENQLLKILKKGN
tara:strand:+ start:886 stop:1065 length:180 start_codon:yes stop_codon:yes gene_type:complete